MTDSEGVNLGLPAMNWLRQKPDPIPAGLLSKLAPATHYLYEWKEYWLEAPGADTVVVGDSEAEFISGNLFRIRFENQLGLSSIQPLVAGRPLTPPLRVEVLSSKFPSPDQHIAFYRELLNDLFARAARLPFHITGPTSRGVTESLRPPTPLFVYYFLLQFGPLLRLALETIHAFPHRMLIDNPDYVPLAMANEADADVLVDILRSPDRWIRASGFPLAQRLHGYAPTKVWQRLPEETLDTPENRFVLAFLRQLLVAAETLPRQSWWTNVPDDRKQTILAATGFLRESLAWRLFDGVGVMQRAPYASQVLLRREGYREMRELFDRFNQARRPLFAQLQHAIEVRDIATLYEQWCFFALVDDIGQALGITPVIELETTVAHGLGWKATARYESEGELIYNKGWKGYSMGLRPDFSWVRNDKLEVVLDAKFRLEWSKGELLEDDALPQSKAKRADLYKMHTYRDALAHKGVRAAVALYPGSKELFFKVGAARAFPQSEDLMLDRWIGIGAAPFLPNYLDKNQDLLRWLK